MRDEGWARPPTSAWWHYYLDMGGVDVSMCRAWAGDLVGPQTVEHADDDPRNCRACLVDLRERRRVMARLQAERGGDSDVR